MNKLTAHEKNFRFSKFLKLLRLNYKKDIRDYVFGFTLVELLMVVSIITVLSASLVPSFSSYIDSQNIKQGVEILKSDLRSAQNKAMTGVDSVSAGANFWAIKIPQNNASFYYYFSSSEATASVCNNLNLSNAKKSKPLSGSVVRNASGVCIFFSRENGDASFVNNGGSSRLYVGKNGETACEGVEINSVGMIMPFDDCP